MELTISTTPPGATICRVNGGVCSRNGRAPAHHRIGVGPRLLHRTWIGVRRSVPAFPAIDPTRLVGASIHHPGRVSAESRGSPRTGAVVREKSPWPSNMMILHH